MAKKPVKPMEAPADDERTMHRVKVSRVVEVAGFRYKPGHEHTVDDATLEALQAADAVADVSTAS